jgi:hypothetical protein
MKKNDIALIIFVVAVTAFFTYFIAQSLLGGSKASKPVTGVESMQPIDAVVTKPEARVFNKDAINPTVKIEIGDTNKQQPFGN